MLAYPRARWGRVVRSPSDMVSMAWRSSRSARVTEWRSSSFETAPCSISSTMAESVSRVLTHMRAA